MNIWPEWVAPLADTGASGIDSGFVWVLISGMGTVISTLASLLYKSERDRRIAAEAKLEKFQAIAPDLAENVRWLVEDAQDNHNEGLPWPVNRDPPRRTNRSNTRRR